MHSLQGNLIFFSSTCVLCNGKAVSKLILSERHVPTWSSKWKWVPDWGMPLNGPVLVLPPLGETLLYAVTVYFCMSSLALVANSVRFINSLLAFREVPVI